MNVVQMQQNSLVLMVKDKKQNRFTQGNTKFLTEITSVLQGYKLTAGNNSRIEVVNWENLYPRFSNLTQAREVGAKIPKVTISLQAGNHL